MTRTTLMTTATILAAGLATTTASAQVTVFEWTNPDGGAWFDADSWDQDTFPDDRTHIARIALDGNYDILAPSRGFDLFGLELLNPELELAVGRLNIWGPEIVNNGVIGAILVPREDSTIRGSGVLRRQLVEFTSGVEFTNGAGHTLRGVDVEFTTGARQRFVNRGILEPLTFDAMDFIGGGGDLILEDEGTIRVVFANDIGNNGRIQGVGTVTFGGSIEVDLSELAPRGDVLRPCSTHEFFRSINTSGRFNDEVVGDPDYPFHIWQIQYDLGPGTDKAMLRLDCYGDFNRDCSFDVFDFLDFQNAFAAGDMAADCDSDGALTLFDFLCFQNAFSAGCG